MLDGKYSWLVEWVVNIMLDTRSNEHVKEPVYRREEKEKND